MNATAFSTHGFAVFVVTALVVLVCVLLHYEVFTWLTRALARMHLRVRRRLVAGR